MKRLSLIAALLACGLVPAASAHTTALHLVKVGHFDAPVYATSTPADPSAMFVVEQQGRIRRLAHGRVSTFLDIRGLVAYGGEQGLLSLAFDPGYAQNRFYYVAYTGKNGDDMVVRYGPGGPHTLLAVPDPAPNHNGGQLQFGPDGDLYWSNGDAGGEGDPYNVGQNLGKKFARIMKLNVHRAGAKWLLVAYGLRNPWRFSFDSGGNLYIADVGQDHWEEIDYLPHGFRGIANFGWPHWEGNHLFRANVPLAKTGRYVRPVAEYSHELGCAVIGGYVWQGRYVFGDACSGTVFSLKMVRGRATTIRREAPKIEGLSAFGLDAGGRLYAMSSASGNLYRVS
jgi:glucose/arabinose dehydrogenase